MTPDSFEYETYAKNIGRGVSLKLLIQPYRVPLYSSIILAAGTSERLMLLQSLAVIGSVLLLYQTMILLGISQILAFAVSLVFASDPLLIPWERMMLTESFAISWVVVLAYFIVRKKLLPVTIWSLVGIYLRPSLVFLPLVVFIFHKSKWLIIFAAFIVFHIYINSTLWNYKGFQVIGEFNLLGRILTLNLPVDNSFYGEKIRDYRATGGIPNPYRFLDWIDPTIYVNSPRLNELATFNHSVIANNLPTFLWRALADIPQAVTGISQFVKPTTFQTPFQIFHAIGFAALLLTLPRILSLVAIVHIVTSVLFGYEDFPRLVAPAIPLLYITTAYLVNQYLSIIKNRFQK